ncbi:MAG: K(+)-transporting ATPase subunit F [Meiothermus sp.]
MGTMGLGLVLLVISVLVGIYLVYALLRPEEF